MALAVFTDGRGHDPNCSGCPACSHEAAAVLSVNYRPPPSQMQLRAAANFRGAVRAETSDVDVVRTLRAAAIERELERVKAGPVVRAAAPTKARAAAPVGSGRQPALCVGVTPAPAAPAAPRAAAAACDCGCGGGGDCLDYMLHPPDGYRLSQRSEPVLDEHGIPDGYDLVGRAAKRPGAPAEMPMYNGCPDPYDLAGLAAKRAARR